MKILALILALLLLLFTLGCSEKNVKSVNLSSEISSVASKVQVTTTSFLNNSVAENSTSSVATTSKVESKEKTTSAEPDSSRVTTTSRIVTSAVTEISTSSSADLDMNQLVGTLYTRAQLEALDNTKWGYGPGVNMDESNRPYGAINEQNKYEKYGANFIAPANGDAYLTFDLGYEYNNHTVKILDILAAKGVKASFFATQSFCEKNPDTVRRIIAEGHTLGNHSVSHLSMPTLSLDKMKEEIMGFHNYVLENFNYEMHLFRPPMGEFSEQSLAVTQSLGYETVHWSFAYKDYDTANQPEIEASFQKVSSAAHSGAIYLLHSVSATNVAILERVIDYLSQSYTLKAFA